ncbi:hypothetical protein [Cellvibrio sp. UBA7671]|uniref:hypothetical protein n=1 Tax=Cellvibrio sp. UBA7671 TaxID=1946312 RepID=UPI002F35C31F
MCINNLAIKRCYAFFKSLHSSNQTILFFCTLFFFSLSTHAAIVTFDVAITAQGQETRSFEQRTYSGHFPYFDIRGGTFGGWPSRTESVEFCVPTEVRQQCTIDTSRSSGIGGPGYGIDVLSINSPGGDPVQSYSLNSTTMCLTSTVTVRAKRLQRGWYEGNHQIYVTCPVRANWSNTETKGTFTLDSASGYSYITNYTGPIGSPQALPGTATVNAVNGYTVTLLNKNPANAVVTSGMFQNTPAQGNNGPRLYALFAANDVMARGMEVTQGVQNLNNDMPLVAWRRTYVRVYASATNAVTDINAELRAFRNGVELGGSPITPENTIPVRSTGIDRTQLNHAFLFKLPPQWTAAGNIELRTTVNPTGLNVDANSINNTWSDSLQFQNAAMNVHVDVPLRIHQNGDRDQPYFIYENTSTTFYPIVSNLTRMHPIPGQIHLDCGMRALRPTIGQWDVSSSGDWGKMLWRVSLARFLNGCGISGSYWHGMVHPLLNNPTNNGIAYGGKQSSVTLMSGQFNEWAMPRGATFAHELGHNKGLDHVCAIGSPDDMDSGYPYNDPCLMAQGAASFFTNGNDGYFMMDVYHDYWGLNEPAILGNSPGVAFPANRRAFPMMSYSAPRWISPYSYCKLLNEQGINCNKALISGRNKKTDNDAIVKNHSDSPHGVAADRNPGAPAVPPYTQAYPIAAAVLPANFIPALVRTNMPAYLLVSGHYNVSKPTLDSFQVMKLTSLPGVAGIEETNKLQTALRAKNTSVYTNVVVLNQYNNATSRSLLKADIVSDFNISDDDSGMPDRFITGLVELASGATYFELAYGPNVIANYAISNNAPTISITPFSEAELTANSQLRWTAQDADNNPLSFTLYYRPNAATNWQLVDTDITANVYTMRDNLPATETNPLRFYAGSPAGQFRVVAFDGFHTVAADSNPIRVPYNAPRVAIMQGDGLSIKPGQTLYLNGSATDTEDGPIPSVSEIQNAMLNGTLNASTKLRWTSNINGHLGYGSQLTTRALSQGIHTITLSVTDNSGAVGSARITVYVGVDKTSITKNIALTATATASSTYCPSPTTPLHCYYASRINDGSTSTTLGGVDSWVNVGGGLPQWVELRWPNKVAIISTELYTSAGYPIQDYDLQYWNGIEWVAFNQVRGNTALQNAYTLPTTVTTDRVRVLGLKGPGVQLSHVRVNELIVNGYVLGATGTGPAL